MLASGAEEQRFVIDGALDSQLPTSLEGVIHCLTQLALQAIDHETQNKQLCYHTYRHAEAVQRRSLQLFQLLETFWPQSPHELAFDRAKQIISLCAIAHDMVQEFVPSASAYKGRQRLTGVSERETIRRLQGLMLAANQRHSDPSAPGYFTPADLALAAEAIEATVCHYNPRMRILYQPSLDRVNPPLPLAARLLALADLGGLAMEGLEAYREEGCLLFLEDNPDVIVLIQGQVAPQSRRSMRAAQENLRQRLLGWSRFQVDFARGRLVRRDQELGALPAASVSWIRQMLFRHLDEAMIAHIEATAPVAEDVSLATLLQFFKFESYL